jgi:hydroxymethylpyrimidine/phosphomethylpyrimidine kinase
MVNGVRSLLVISGLDPSGGAGLLADVRVAADFGCRAVGVVTAHTVQNSGGLRSSHPVSAEIIADQLRALLSDVEVAAVKIGMLGEAAVARAVGDGLALTDAPVVWDPVMRPSLGRAPLFEGDPRIAVETLRGHIALMTPNLTEAELLSGLSVVDLSSMRRAAVALEESWQTAVLITGGHLVGAPVDVLCNRGELFEFPGERVPAPVPVHGTGCALSTAIAAGLAGGAGLLESVRRGADFVRQRLWHPVVVGRGRPSLM